MSFLSAHRQKLLITLIHTRHTVYTVCRTGTYTHPKKQQPACDYSKQGHTLRHLHFQIKNSSRKEEKMKTVHGHQNWFFLNMQSYLIHTFHKNLCIVQSIFVECGPFLNGGLSPHGAVYLRMVPYVSVWCSLFL